VARQQCQNDNCCACVFILLVPYVYCVHELDVVEVVCAEGSFNLNTV
jgi:hypothetical protein